MADTPFKAAYDEVDITPPKGTSMPGYFKDRQATGTLDQLKAKVLCLEKGDERIALVACDLIGMAAPIVKRIRDEVVRQGHGALPMNVLPRHVWIHCSHTHTGGMLPRAGSFTSDAEAIYSDFYAGKVDENWVKELVSNTALTILKAMRKLAEEKKLTLHAGTEKGIAHYRRYIMKDGSVRTNPGRGNKDIVRPAGEIDPRVHVLQFHTHKILTVIYGMHPDCVGGTQFSADYPHHLTETLRHALGHDWRVLFLNACSGNINHINVNDPKQLKGPEESKRLGEALALAVLEALKKGEPLKVDKLVAKSKQVPGKLRKPLPAEVKEAEELLRVYKETGKGNPFGFNELYAPAVVVLDKTKDKEHFAEISALRLGSFGLATMPGEIFVELGREVEDGSPFRPTRTIGLTNGAMGYIPTKRAYAEGGYEAGYRSARYEENNGHNWAAAAVEILKAMKD